MLAIIGDDYIIKSNKESGEGRYDIMLIPRNLKTESGKSRNGVVIEIKQIEKQRKSEENKYFIDRVNKWITSASNQHK